MEMCHVKDEYVFRCLWCSTKKNKLSRVYTKLNVIVGMFACRCGDAERDVKEHPHAEWMIARKNKSQT